MFQESINSTLDPESKTILFVGGGNMASAIISGLHIPNKSKSHSYI